MRVAEHLYLNEFITYPRTESTDYSENFDFKEILNVHKNHKEWGFYASRLLANGHETPRAGKDAGDHPPITPVKSADESQLSDLEWRLYQFITQNFLATISKSAHYKVIKANFMVGPEFFEVSGKQMISQGFLEITPWLSSSQNVDLPDFEQQKNYEIKEIKIIQGKTTSPGYLTESDLISCMEANEIGTDASIPTHIKNIIERGYVKVNAKKGRSLVPTNLGMALGKAYCEVDSELILPKVRSYIEKSCQRVAKGEVDFKFIINHVLKIFKGKFEFLQEKFAIIDGIIKRDFVDRYEEERKKENKEKGKGFNPTAGDIGFPEELKSYEHCRVFEDYKATIVEKSAHLICNSCTKGELKKIKMKSKKKTSTIIFLR